MTTRQTAITILIGAAIIWAAVLFLFGHFRFQFFPAGLLIATIMTVIWLLAIIRNIFKTEQRRDLVTEIGIIILTIGSIGLVIALISIAFTGKLYFYWPSRFWVILPISWFLVLLGGLLIGLRVAALTLILLGIYIFTFSFIFFKPLKETTDTFLTGIYIAAFVIAVLHIILGLILGITSFILHKKYKK